MDNSNLINNTINPVESLARNIVASIKAGNTSNHTKSDTSESWNITNVDDGGKSGLYRLEITNGINKSGKKNQLTLVSIRKSLSIPSPITFNPIKSSRRSSKIITLSRQSLKI